MSSVSIDNKTSWRVVVIGSGNVAEALAKALSRAEGVELCQIFARNEVRGRELAALASTSWSNRVEELAAADVYIISVSDRAVEELSGSLPFADDAIVVHTAGSVAIDAIAHREGGRGILYAFQSFTAGVDVDFGEIPIFIEGDSAAVEERLWAFASKLTSRVYRADSELRRRIHLSGVFVNNFVNHLYAIGSDILSVEGLPFEILHPLIMETARKAICSHNPRSVQTGPAVRGDGEVCRRHTNMLSDNELAQRIYNDITNSIWETSKKI